jgi:hypothetical protein
MKTGGLVSEATIMFGMTGQTTLFGMKAEKMTTAIFFNKLSANRLHKDLNEVLQAFAEKNGLEFQLTRASVGTFEFNKKIKFSIKSKAAADATASIEKDKFQTYSSKYGYDWRLFGKIVNVAGIEYKVIGVNPRSYRKPVKLERVSDGLGFKCASKFLPKVA